MGSEFKFYSLDLSCLADCCETSHGDGTHKWSVHDLPISGHVRSKVKKMNCYSANNIEPMDKLHWMILVTRLHHCSISYFLFPIIMFRNENKI